MLVEMGATVEFFRESLHAGGQKVCSPRQRLGEMLGTGGRTLGGTLD